MKDSILFKGMTAAEVLELMSISENLSLKSGTTVFKEGDKGDALFVIENGSVMVCKSIEGDKQEILAEMEAGEFFGEMALIDNAPRSANVITLEPTKLYKISSGALSEFTAKKPQLAIKLYHNFAAAISANLRRSSEKLYNLAVEGRSAKGSADNLISELVSVVSRELRTPVNVIKGATDVLDTASLAPEKQRSLFSMIQKHTDYLSRLFDDITQLSEVQYRGISIEKKPQKILPVIKDAISKLSEKAEKQGIKIELEMPDDMPNIPIHAGKMGRVFYHLIDNGIRYNKKGGKLMISVKIDRSTQSMALFSIKDEGPGIPKERHGDIFKHFYQKTPPLDPNRSSGIGLPLSNSLISAHGGSLRYEPAREGGSLFLFTLPLK